MATPTIKTPDLYIVHSNVIQGGEFSINIAYSTSGIDGKPHLQYQDTHQTLQFSGEQIRTVDTEIGTLVTVTLHITPDSGSTTFTLFVPKVNLGQSNQIHIRTFGVTTMHRFSLIPILNVGQTQTYSTVQMNGTAELVAF